MEDTGAPTVTIRVPEVAPLRLWVSWSGHRPGIGLAAQGPRQAGCGVRPARLRRAVQSGRRWHVGLLANEYLPDRSAVRGRARPELLLPRAGHGLSLP
jgi:hypothetical protein